MDFDPRIIELMNARVDGVISERENSELVEFMARSHEAREQFDELERISRMIDGAEWVAPPETLRGRVMAAIQPSVSPNSVTAASGGKRLLGYTYAAAAGLILGVLGHHFFSSGNVGPMGVAPSDAAGTMTSIQAQAEATVIETIGLDLPHGGGTVLLAQVEGGTSVVVDLDSPSAIEVGLAFDAGEIGFRGLTQDLGEVRSLEVTDGTVTWTQHGHVRVAVAVKLRGETPATINLTLLMDGESMQGAVLSLPVPGSSEHDSEEPDSDVDSSKKR